MAYGLNYTGWDSLGLQAPQGAAASLFPSDYGDLGNQGVNSALGFQAPSAWGGSLGSNVPSFSLPAFGGGAAQGAGNGVLNSLRSSGFLGQEGQQGWGGLALGALSSLGSTFLGMKNYGLAKDSLNQSREQFDKNYAAQRSTINTQLEDRQRARVAATGGTAESVDSYLQRNRIV